MNFISNTLKDSLVGISSSTRWKSYRQLVLNSTAIACKVDNWDLLIIYVHVCAFVCTHIHTQSAIMYEFIWLGNMDRLNVINFFRCLMYSSQEPFLVTFLDPVEHPRCGGWRKSENEHMASTHYCCVDWNSVKWSALLKGTRCLMVISSTL